MSLELNGIREKLSIVASNKTVLDLLLEFERMLDNTDVFSYNNWLNGELVSGPEIERYWVTCTFMYPHKLMPDPMAGMRLQKFGCKVTFREDKFKCPVKVTSTASYRDTHTKKVKLKIMPVWLVTIQIPRKFIDGQFIEAMLTHEQEVETDEISNAYDETADVQDEEDFGGDMDMGDDLDMGME